MILSTAPTSSLVAYYYQNYAWQLKLCQAIADGSCEIL